MAYKYLSFADLLYTSYSGLQMLAFAFGKGKNRCDKDCYAFRQSVIRKLKAVEMKISDLYQNIVRLMTSPHDACWYCGRSVSVLVKGHKAVVESAKPGFNMTSYLGVDAIEAATWYDSLTAA